MEDIFHDPEFENMLYGGVHDLEEPVGKLVYNLWKAGVETSWSCAGHIGRFIRESEKQAFPGYFVYEEGKLWYPPSSRGDVLTEEIERVVARNSHFARLERRDSNQFYLSMSDIAVRFDGLERGYEKLQVLEDLARERYLQFLGIWRELTDWSEGLVK